MDAIDSSWGILILCGELDFTVHEVIQGHFLYLYMFFWQMVTLFGLWQFMAHHITKQIIGENLMTWLDWEVKIGLLEENSMSLDGLGRYLMIEPSPLVCTLLTHGYLVTNCVTFH